VYSVDAGRREELERWLEEAGLLLGRGGRAGILILDGEVAAPLPEGPLVVLLRPGGAAPQPRPGLAVLTDDPAPAELVAAVWAAEAGLYAAAGTLLPGRAAEPAVDESGGPGLTPREREVVRLMAAGLPNKGIARALGISENTVKFHVAGILTKLDVQSRAEAVMQAARRGLIPL
jgi:DNA-binding CsgD family transcriptional regulator